MLLEASLRQIREVTLGERAEAVGVPSAVVVADGPGHLRRSTLPMVVIYIGDQHVLDTKAVAVECSTLHDVRTTWRVDLFACLNLGRSPPVSVPVSLRLSLSPLYNLHSTT